MAEVTKPFARGNKQPHIVLLCTEHETTPALREAFMQVAWPAGYQVSALELRDEPEPQRWFSLHDPPAVAVVFDGSVLALEYACTADACRRLLRVAEAQHRRFDQL